MKLVNLKNRTLIFVLIMLASELLPSKNLDGAKPETPSEKTVEIRTVEDARTLLKKASLNKKEQDALKQFIKNSKKEVLNEQDTLGRSPLHIAVQYGHEKIATQLIDKGVDIEAADQNRIKPLHLSAQDDKNLTLTKQLIESGAMHAPLDDTGNTPLHYAAKNGSVKTLNYLLSITNTNYPYEKKYTPELINLQDETKNTALSLANQNINSAQELLIAGATVDKLDQNQKDRLLLRQGKRDTFVNSEKKIENITYLLDQGANINAQNKEGNTILHIAVESWYDTIVQHLLDKTTIDKEIKNKENKTAYEIAFDKKNPHPKAIALFIKKDSKLEEKLSAYSQEEKNSLLRLAASQNVPELIDPLITAEAEINSEDKSGHTALKQASYASAGHKKVIEKLLTHENIDLLKGFPLEEAAHSQATLRNVFVPILAAMNKQLLTLLKKDSLTQTEREYLSALITEIKEKRFQTHTDFGAKLYGDVFLFAGTDVPNYTFEDKNTVLHLLIHKFIRATEEDKKFWNDQIEMIILAGASLIAKNNKNKTPYELLKDHRNNFEKLISDLKYLIVRNMYKADKIQKDGKLAEEEKELQVSLHKTKATSFIKQVSGISEIINFKVPMKQKKLEFIKYAGKTPLHMAAEHGYERLAESLLKAGADTSITTPDGSTALELAQQNKYTDLAKKIVKHLGEKSKAERLLAESQPKAEADPSITPPDSSTDLKHEQQAGQQGTAQGEESPKAETPLDNLATNLKKLQSSLSKLKDALGMLQ